MSPLAVVYAAPVLFLVWGSAWVRMWRRLLSQHTLDNDGVPYGPVWQMLDSSRYDQRGKELLRVLWWSTAAVTVAYLLVVWWALNVAANR